MEMKPEVAEMPKYRGGTHRIFWWGTGLLMLAWILSVCGLLAFVVNVKDCRGVKIGAGAGALICEIDQGDHRVVFTVIKIREHQWIWEGDALQQIAQNRGVASVLANGDWRTIGGKKYMAFPMAGLLWLWLAAAWVVSAKRKRPLRALTLALIVVGGVTAYGVIQGQRARDAAICWLNIRNIQQAVRSACGMGGVSYGSPIPWERVFGPGGFMRPESRACPTGPEYQIESLQPGNGKAAAHCQNPDHQRAFLKKDITDW